MICICPHCGEVFESSSNQKKQPTKKQLTRIIDLCADHFGVEYNTIISKFRGGKATKARHLAMYFIYGEGNNGISEESTGEIFNRDHSTVLNARNRVKDSIDTRMDVFKDLITLSPQVEEILTGTELKIAS